MATVRDHGQRWVCHLSMYRSVYTTPTQPYTTQIRIADKNRPRSGFEQTLEPHIAAPVRLVSGYMNPESDICGLVVHPGRRHICRSPPCRPSH